MPGNKTGSGEKGRAVEKKFRYTRDDFPELPVKLEHMTIYLNFIDGRVEAENRLEMTAKTALDRIDLDAKDLEIKEVSWCAGPDDRGEALEFEYKREADKLMVKLSRRVEKGQRFFIRTKTACTPSDRILEGIYKDATPDGAPQQYISQCQQWGFQRIMPVFDDCRAKCTMTTTIEALSAYTRLISNGNVKRETNPGGVPVAKPGSPGRAVVTYENPIPMPPYLFFVCAGTWETLSDEVTYPSGRKVRLEYLVPPGSKEAARTPMEILKKSVLWVGEKQGYEYTFDTYRTICMAKSNFGGMENLGNTTIVTDAALITEHTLDTLLLYAHAVIVHEFEHNQCGSETTMATPFDIWLNEAYTVDVERQFMADLFDPSFVRLFQVDSIRDPLLGPLAIEDAGHFGRVVRDGFNEPGELIDGVTYVKAAEVIRMLRLVIGDEAFRAGKALYFSRYRFGNADTAQFFACFEEVSGISLEQFKSEWLYRVGYPKVSARTRYDAGARRYHIIFTQEGAGDPFCLPIKLALVGEGGRDIEGTAKVYTLKEKTSELVFDKIKRPPLFASMDRDYSFYGTFEHKNATREELLWQMRLDPNAYNRVDAMKKLTDVERIRLLEDPGAKISEEWLSLYGEAIGGGPASDALRSYFLRIYEQPLDRKYSTWYQELVFARERLMKEAGSRYRAALIEEFKKISRTSPADKLSADIERRMLKNTLLELIAIDDTPGSHALVLEYLRQSANATEQLAALVALNRSSSPERHRVLEEFYGKWRGTISGYANYLRAVSSGTREDVFEMIGREKTRPGFDVTQPTWTRALFLTMAANNKMVWSDQGISWVADTVKYLSPVNTTTASRLLNTFQNARALRPGLREKAEAALKRIVMEVTEETNPVIHAQAKAYLGER